MAKAVNIIGDRYGYLTVLERAESNKKGNTQWLCKCDCGNTKICLGYDLTHGRTTTCGCGFYNKEKPSMNRISLVGNKYGKLIVESLNEEKSNNGVLYWNCLCECGNEHIVSGSNLKNGHVTHCGCSRSRSHNFKDITGNKYGFLTVLGIKEKRGKSLYWLCQCDCGEVVVVNGNELKSGSTKSCGNHKIHKFKRKERVSKTLKRIRIEWRSMINRCSEKYHGRKHYFDKGIAVCEEWLNDFDKFKTWALQNGYEDNLTLDRIDNNKNYEPSNCRWVTNKQQQNNKTVNVYVELNGITKTLKEWSEYFDFPYTTAKARRRSGWPKERWFEPLHKNQYA